MSDITPSRYVRRLPAGLADPASGASVSPGATGPGGDEQEVPLWEYWRIVFKYRLVILACSTLAVALALLYAFTATPQYTASSRIRISSYEPILGSTRIEDMLQQKSLESNYLETQIEEIRSFSLADRVLEDPEVKAALERSSGPGLLARLFPALAFQAKAGEEGGDTVSGYKSTVSQIRRYLDAIEVRPIRRTALVVIEATFPDPVVAALIAERHALAYMDWVRNSRIEQQSRGLSFLRQQAEELREKVSDIEREMADYAEANSIVAVNKDENITAQRLAQLNRLVTDVTAKRIEAEKLHEEARSGLDGSSAGFDDSSTQSLRTELARLEAERSQLGAKFTESYPKMGQLASQIAELRRSIESQRGQIVAGLKARAAAAAEEEKNLREELEQQKSRAFELSKKQVAYNSLNRELTSSRELLENVLRQIKETSLAVEGNASNVSIVDHATVPLGPAYPRKRYVLLLGAALGLAVGVGLAFLLSYLDNTFRHPDEVASSLGLPALGVVPAFESVAALPGAAPVTSPGRELVPMSGDSLPIVFIQAPKSLAAEAYRTIRTGILLSQAGEPPRTILVTSAQSSEGKTTSSINLAVSLASSGGRVVLVDADLRRPAVHRHLKLSAHLPGLVDVLTGQRSLEEVVQPEVARRVTFVPSGAIPPNPAELLGSLEMAALIDRLAGEYDYVLIDSAPVLPVTDSVILSRYVDGVVLVVKGASTPRKVVVDARRRLSAVGARMLGVVLNNVDVTNGDYYYYYNRSYSPYYQNEPGSSRAANSGQG